MLGLVQFLNYLVIMPRKPRHQVQDMALHISQRGNNRQACFFCEADRLHYLDHLHRAAAAYECEVHAYALMTNHVHLLITPHRPGGASSLMQSQGRSYVRYVNATHQRSGTLWEGRFKASPVDSARYVLACYRYIEQNPVRAGMLAEPTHYRWSSCAHNCGLTKNPLITPHAAYLELGSDLVACQRQYHELVMDELDELGQIRGSLRRNLMLR